MKKIANCYCLLFYCFISAQEAIAGSTDLNELVLIEKNNNVTGDIEKAAEFPKGINVFRQMLLKNFRGKKIKGTENMSCELLFIIDKTGSMTDIKATGNNQSFNEEVIRSVSKIKDKWVPAEINGQKVRYRVRIPLHFNFDSPKK
ncbi:energy transducer TonB [Chryseobacterium sp. MYb264]|uniref:energy transducer TonB n=1 Tax=Chryseobacterium sp. MYb264 TaxID=2745153 RepID=UPI002E131C00|nr:energy transducer TonB [Chryseobacterium sp. MYb264]